MNSNLSQERSIKLPASNLDWLRHLFSLEVIYEHSYVLTRFPTSAVYSSPVTKYLNFDFGDLAVKSFFILSGFCIQYSMEGSASLLHFYVKRFLRIFPEFLLMVLGIACILPAIYDRSWYWLAWFVTSVALIRLLPKNVNRLGKAVWLLGGAYVAVTIVMLRSGYRIGMNGTMDQVAQVLSIGEPSYRWSRMDIDPNNPFYAIREPLWRDLANSVWTIRYEELSYFFLALQGYVKLSGKPLYKHKFIPIAIYLACYLMNVYIYANGGQDVARLPNFITFGISDRWFNHFVVFYAYFMGGSLFYQYRDKIPIGWKSMAASTGVLWAGFYFFRETPILHYLLPIFGVHLILAVGLGKWQLPELKRKGKKVDLSYGMYLWHFAVIQVLMDIGFLVFWGDDLSAYSPLAVFAGSTVVSMIIAWISWFSIGSFAMRYKSYYPVIDFKWIKASKTT